MSEADVRAATERLRGRLGTVARKRREPPEGREPRREPRREREPERREAAECAECAECEETVCPAGFGGPAGPAAGACKAVYRVYNKWGGVDGAIGEGLTGTLTPGHMCAVLCALGVAERETTFVDIGAADGRALVCAAMLGAKRVVGYELPGPGKIHENVMNGVRALLSKECPGKITAKFEYVKKDIAHESALPEGTTAVYCFWDGFARKDQKHVSALDLRVPHDSVRVRVPEENGGEKLDAGNAARVPKEQRSDARVRGDPQGEDVRFEGGEERDRLGLLSVLPLVFFFFFMVPG